MKRLGIYFFYDKDGIVDDYVPYFLERFKPFLSELCIVVNGNLTPQSRQKLEPFAEKILPRENTGFDAWAYKHALETYGYDALQQYDEVILCNYTFFGPFFPLENIFSKMDKITCDWWAPYKWPTQRPVKYHHLPSFWTAYRKTLLSSADFRHYWQTLHPISSYDDSTLYHEQRQTPYYDKRGYTSAVWMDHEKYRPFWQTSCWPLVCADRAVTEDGYPFIKRRNFYIDKGLFVYPHVILNIIPFLQEKTSYDWRLIIDDLQRTLPPLEPERYLNKMPLWRFLEKYHPFPSKRKHYTHKIQRMLLSAEIKKRWPQLVPHARP